MCIRDRTGKELVMRAATNLLVAQQGSHSYSCWVEGEQEVCQKTCSVGTGYAGQKLPDEVQWHKDWYFLCTDLKTCA